MTTENRTRTARRRWWIMAAALASFAVGVAVLWALRPAQNPQVSTAWQRPTTVPKSTPLASDQLAFDSDRNGNFELYTMPSRGGAVRRLTYDPHYDSWSPRISPDRRTLAFYRSPAGTHDRDPAAASLWLVATDGSGLAQIRPAGLDGWVFQGHAEWSPQGTSLVMFGGSRVNPQIFVTSPLGHIQSQLTDRPGVNLDPVFSGDGRSVFFVGCPQALCRESDYEIYQIGASSDAGTSQPARHTQNHLRDQDPMLSPDGRTLAWLTSYGGPGLGTWDIQLRDAAASQPRRLIGDAGVTSRPQFSADGKYLYFHRIAPGRQTFNLYRSKLDGTELQEITAGQPGNNEYPAL